MTTTDKIQKAIKMMNEHDWWWAWADYCTEPRDKAYGHMRAFVELVASIDTPAIVATLRTMWEISAKQAWSDDKDKRAEYQSMIDELMDTLQPSTLSIAA
mgnify:CR=1 FL=1|jgi:hypothetical protein